MYWMAWSDYHNPCNGSLSGSGSVEVRESMWHLKVSQKPTKDGRAGLKFRQGVVCIKLEGN